MHVASKYSTWFWCDTNDSNIVMNGDMVDSVADFLDNASDDDLKMDENGGLTSKHMKSLENLYRKFEGYCEELAVFGFNSAGKTLNSSGSSCLRNCVNMDSNLLSLSKRLESNHVSRLNTLNSWRFCSF